MTKKHFLSIATILDANAAPLYLVADMADYFAEVNPNFDRKAFIEASTVTIKAKAERELRDIAYEANV